LLPDVLNCGVRMFCLTRKRRGPVMLLSCSGIRGMVNLVTAIVWLGFCLGTTSAQTTLNAPVPNAYPYASVAPRDPFYLPFINGYPRNYYSYSVSNLLPTYLTSINYPRIYGAYSYGMAPGAYTEGAMPSPYAVAPPGFRSVYPPAVAPVQVTPIGEPVPTDGAAQ